MDDELSNYLDDCLQRLAGGDSEAECLARYPDHAAALEPMLAAASAARRLAALDMPAGRWSQVRTAIQAGLESREGVRLARERAASHPRSRMAFTFPHPISTAGIARLAAVVIVLCLALGATAVAASGPDGFPYEWRLTAERVPIWLAGSPAGQNLAELAFSDRRLADVRAQVFNTGTVPARALAALLSSDADAAELAASLAVSEQDEIGARIAGHADCLQQMGRSAHGERASQTLLAASERVRATALSIGVGGGTKGGACRPPEQ